MLVKLLYLQILSGLQESVMCHYLQHIGGSQRLFKKLNIIQCIVGQRRLGSNFYEAVLFGLVVKGQVLIASQVLHSFGRARVKS